VERSVELSLPEGEELLEGRESRKEVVILPDIFLDQGAVIRDAIENLRGRETITLKLSGEIR
jgi:hypothetical protein